MNGQCTQEAKLSRTIYGNTCNPESVKSSECLCLVGESGDHTSSQDVREHVQIPKPPHRYTRARRGEARFKRGWLAKHGLDVTPKVKPPKARKRSVWRYVPPRPKDESEIRERFWNNARTGAPEECWPWVGRLQMDLRGQDYGIFFYNGKAKHAHRVSWLFRVGPIPEGMVVMHVCDNPRCVNPAHLRVGTQGENMRDCAMKGRASRTPRRNLYSLEKVNEWYRRHQADPKSDSCVNLAREFGVSMATMRRAVTGKHWRQLREAKRMAQEVLPLTA